MLLAVVVAPVRAYDLIRQANGQPTSWDTGPIAMRIKMATTPTLTDGTNFATSVQQAMLDWNGLLGRVQFAPTILDAAPAVSGDKLNDIVFDTTIYGQEFDTNTLAVTVSYHYVTPRDDGSNIYSQSDIIFNNNGKWSWDSFRGPLAGHVPEDIRRVAIHELGHVLGLDHPDQASPPQSVTAVMNSRESDVDTMQADDIAGAQFLYGSKQPPANDNFSSAFTINLSGNSAQVTGNNISATKEGGEPDHDPGSGVGGASVWWKWTATGAGSLVVSTTGSAFDTLLGAYTGGAVGSLTQLASNDDESSSPHLITSKVTLGSVAAGTTYYFAVDGWDADMGSILLTLNFTPAVVNVAPSITSHPAGITQAVGQAAQFIVAASGTPAPGYQWQVFPSGGSAWSDLGNGGSYSGVTTAMLTVSGLTTLMNASQYRCVVSNVAGTVSSNAATLTVFVPLPVITVQPVSQGVLLGSAVSLSATATSPVAMSYAWRKDGVLIPSGTSPTYSIASFSAGDVGSYVLSVGNSAGVVTTNAATLVIALPPVVTTDPATQTVILGAPVVFSVGVTSNAATSYVWRKNGTPIPGATASTYTIASAGAADAADYSVVVSNVAGSATSAAATLTVQLPPAITQQPANQQVLSGSTATFSVVATSTTALSYHWQRLAAGSGTWGNLLGDYSGFSTATLTAANQPFASNGDQFRCIITNVAGSVTSNPALLTVTPAGITKIVAGRYHSLRLDIFAGFSACGTNLYGQLGSGNTLTFTSPVFITLPGPTIADAAAGAQHSLILTTTKELWVTGFNGNGQLGDGKLVARSTPFKLVTNVAGMAAAVFHSAYIKTDGTLWTVGGNDSGQLGNGTLTDSTTATQVATDVVDVALGNRQSFFIKSDGSLWGMGDMNGSGTPVSTPVQIASNVVAVAAGAYHSLFLKTDGTLWAMGYNPFGQLGTGDTTDRLTPVQVATGVKAVTAGYFFSAYLKTDGTLWATGRNDFGQLGDGTNTNRPAAFQLASNVYAVSASESYTLFAKNDGSLWGTGLNGNGQFGNGNTTTVTTPVQISTGTVLVPATPSALTAGPVATLDRVHLLWQPAADARTYEVWRNSVNDSATATRLAQGLRWAIYQDLTAATGQTYYYWTKAVNAAGTSAFSAPALGSSSNAIAPSITTQPATQTVNVGDSVTFTVVAGGTGPFTYQWRLGGSNLPGATDTSYTIASAAVADAGSYDVVVTNSAGNTTSAAATLTVSQLAQTITFNTPADRAYTTVPFTLSATASSSLAVTFSILSGPATLSGNDVTLTGVGTVTVRAAQAGNATYAAAANVDRSITVSQATASVALGSLGATYSGAPQGASATTNPSGLTVNFTYDGGATAPTNAGSYAVVGTISDTNYAGSASGTLTISKAGATVTLGSLTPTYDGAAHAATATTNPGSLTVNFTYDGGATAPTNAGSYAVVGTISDANYTGNASDTLVIAKADQTISFTGPADQPYSATPLTLSATASSGLTVTFSVNSGPATVAATVLTLTGSGVVTVRASQAGDANRNAAPDVDRSFTVTGNFASWQQAKFTADELLNHPELTGPNAIYGTDGLPNLLKYALGLEPKQDITSGLPEVSTTATDWVYTYVRPITTTDLTYEVEVSTNLTTWTTAGVTHELVSTGAGTETWQGRCPLASLANVVFQLKVTRP